MFNFDPLQWVFLGFPCGSAGKESAYNAGDLRPTPGLGRFPGEGKCYPLQYSSLETSTDCIVHGVVKNCTRLSDFHLTSAIGIMPNFISTNKAWENLLTSLSIHFNFTLHFISMSEHDKQLSFLFYKKISIISYLNIIDISLLWVVLIWLFVFWGVCLSNGSLKYLTH